MNRSRLFGAACSAMFLFGIVLAMLGTIFGLEETRGRLHVDLAQQGDIFLALFLGVFLSTVLVGPVIDRYGNKIVLATSALLVAAALVLFSMAVSFAAAIIAAFLIGLGGGGLNTAANALVADLYRDDRGAMLNAVEKATREARTHERGVRRYEPPKSSEANREAFYLGNARKLYGFG